MSDPLDNLNPTDLAFERSGGYFFNGEKLEPFSSRRKRVAGALGMRMFFRVDAEDWRSLSNEGTYDGIDQDIATVLWVCLQTPARLIRALRFRNEAIEELNDWADSAEIAVGENRHAEAIEAFSEIIMDIINSQAENADDDGKKTGADGDGEEGKPTQMMPPTKSHYAEGLGEHRITSDGKSRLPEVANTYQHSPNQKV